MRNIIHSALCLLVLVFVFFLTTPEAWGLSCGRFDYPRCDGPDVQYGGRFHPRVGYGGFGGGPCRAERTPVIFIHGNGERATGWDAPVVGQVEGHEAPSRSVYAEFRARGYNDCELFGITYLSAEEQKNPRGNYHRPRKYDILIHFIEAVKAYTGKNQVDIVAHSMGVSMTLAALTFHADLFPNKNGWTSVRRFVNIAGGVRGLPACLSAGFINPFVATCGSQNFFNDYTFGFYPDSGFFFGANAWTGADGPRSLRLAPVHHPKVLFYTISAGRHDQIHCSTARRHETCAEGPLFVKSANIRAQLNVGAGAQAQKRNFNFKNWTPAELDGGDADGIGHFKAKNNTGRIIFEMLNSDCEALTCKGNYTGGPVSLAEE